MPETQEEAPLYLAENKQHFHWKDPIYFALMVHNNVVEADYSRLRTV